MAENRNIIFITNLHLWSIDNGKGGKAFFHTINGYIDEGWNIWLISTGGGIPQEVRSKVHVIENEFPYLDKLINSGNKIISVFSRFLKLYNQTRFYTHVAGKVIKENANLSFIIYAYEVEGVNAASIISKKFNFPLVTRFQGTILASVQNSFINRIRYSPHFTALSVKANLVIMTNDGTQGLQTIKRLNNGSKEILFWRNGVDKLIQQSKKRVELRQDYSFNNECVFVTVSRLVGWKRVHLAIEFFAAVKISLPKSRLVIIGDGPEYDKLKALSKKLNIHDSVQFLGAVNQSEVSNYLVASDIFLSFYDLSNLGNPIMEAMIAGKPIITIDVGDTRELIKNNVNGILIENDKLELIPSCMLKLAMDQALSFKLAEGALATAKNEFWTWKERISAEIEKVRLLNEDGLA